MVMFRIEPIQRQHLVVGSEKCICSQSFSFGQGRKLFLGRDNDVVQDLDIWEVARSAAGLLMCLHFIQDVPRVL